MNELEKILAKKASELSELEKSYLREHRAELDSEQKAAFASVLGDEQEVVIGKDLLEDLSTSVVKGITPIMEAKISEGINKQSEKFIEANEKTIKKNINGGTNDKIVNCDMSKDKIDLESQEKRFAKAYMAMQRGDSATLSKYNAKALKSRTEKAGYGSEGVNADGGYLVPDADFEAEVLKLIPDYGVAFTECTVRQVRGNSVKVNKRATRVQMYDTAEAEAKTGTKMTFEQIERSLRKFAAIAPATDELTEDAAVDFWSEITQGFAEARAQWADKIIFTENNTGIKKGIMRIAGTLAEPIGAGVANITWDDVMNAWAKLPSGADKNAKLYLHKTVWNVLKQVKDDNSRYQYFEPMGMSTPGGLPIVLGDIFPSVTDVDGDANTPYGVVADMKKTRLYVKKGMVLTMLKEGLIKDSEGSDVNLGLQDEQALRAVTRMMPLFPFPEAACILGTGGVS